MSLKLKEVKSLFSTRTLIIAVSCLLLIVSLTSCGKNSKIVNEYPKIWWGNKQVIMDYLNKSPYNEYIIMTKDEYK